MPQNWNVKSVLNLFFAYCDVCFWLSLSPVRRTRLLPYHCERAHIAARFFFVSWVPHTQPRTNFPSPLPKHNQKNEFASHFIFQRIERGPECVGDVAEGKCGLAKLSYNRREWSDRESENWKKVRTRRLLLSYLMFHFTQIISLTRSSAIESIVNRGLSHSSNESIETWCAIWTENWSRGLST